MIDVGIEQIHHIGRLPKGAAADAGKRPGAFGGSLPGRRDNSQAQATRFPRA